MHRTNPKIARFSPIPDTSIPYGKNRGFFHHPKIVKKSKKAFITKTNPFPRNPMPAILVRWIFFGVAICHRDVTPAVSRRIPKNCTLYEYKIITKDKSLFEQDEGS